MTPLPNPFLSDSAASFPFVADTAVASAPPAPVIDAAATHTDNLGSDISNVAEIFLFAKMLCAEARVRPGTISQEALGVAEEITAYEEAYRDPPPLFLRKVS